MKPENPASPAAQAGKCPAARASVTGGDKTVTLSLEAARVGSAVVLHCEGRVIFRSEARSVASIISEVLPSARRMVVDLAGVRSLDSEALGELVLAHLWAEAAGYALKFACPNSAVRKLFENTNLASVFDVYASVPEAVAAMHLEEARPA